MATVPYIYPSDPTHNQADDGDGVVLVSNTPESSQRISSDSHSTENPNQTVAQGNIINQEILRPDIRRQALLIKSELWAMMISVDTLTEHFLWYEYCERFLADAAKKFIPSPGASISTIRDTDDSNHIAAAQRTLKFSEFVRKDTTSTMAEMKELLGKLEVLEQRLKEVYEESKRIDLDSTVETRETKCLLELDKDIEEVKNLKNQVLAQARSYW